MKRPAPLPAPATSFVGRERDLSRISETFARGARLVTLLGPPGIGKSRLALRYAERGREAFDPHGGVWFADLTDARRPEDVSRALVRARPGMLDGSGFSGDAGERLGRFFGALGPTLIILDNCEGAVRTVSELASRCLSLAPDLRLLATSRERLGLSTEFIHELGPLRLPLGPADVEQSEAVQLFLERARAVRSGFAITARNAEALFRITTELDGLPLAIELAATRMAVLSAQDLLERLPRRFELLAQSHRDVTGRQRTLKAAIESSFASLSEAERHALAQASVFRGGFTIDAAEAVIRLPGRRAPALVDVLQTLRERSLLHTSPSQTGEQELRFGLYLSIRDYAQGWLMARGLSRAVEARHTRHFLALARREATERDGGGTHSAFRRLSVELENLRAVHRRLVEPRSATRRSAAQSVELCSYLEPVLSSSAPASQQAMLDASLSTGRLDARARAEALRLRAQARHSLGRLKASYTDAQAALKLARRLKDPKAWGHSLLTLSWVQQIQGDHDESAVALREALPLLRRVRSASGETQALILLASLHLTEGRPDEAEEATARALALAERAGLHALRLRVWTIQALVHITRCELQDARSILERSQEQAQADLNLTVEAHCRWYLGLVWLDEGAPDHAAGAFRRSIELFRRVGNLRFEGLVMGLLANALHEQGRIPEALSRYDEAIRLLRESGDRRGEALFCAAAAAGHGGRGDVAEAEALLRRSRFLLRRGAGKVLPAIAASYEAAARSPDTRPRPSELAELTCVSFHARIAARIASRMAEEPGVNGPWSPSMRPRAEHALVVSRDGRWARLPDGREVVFQRARALRLMLLRLFEERLERPGHALNVRELFASGWPGERVAEGAAENRVYVGLSRLRKMGLHSLIVSRDDGFLLDPELPARWRQTPSV